MNKYFEGFEKVRIETKRTRHVTCERFSRDHTPEENSEETKGFLEKPGSK